ncbi:hypothetical protein CsSME_00019926 [Camellia sinensis var. sinensis]
MVVRVESFARNISTRSMRPPSGGPLPMTVVVFDHSAADTVCSECIHQHHQHLESIINVINISNPLHQIPS